VVRRFGWTRIHMEKLQDVGEELQHRSLATRDGEDVHSPWFLVEPQTADDFMAYSAAVLGQLTWTDAFCPITDQKKGLAPFLPESKSDVSQAAFRNIVLERILPAPAEAMEPSRLADFMAKHKSELQRFRRDVEDKISELIAITDDDDRRRRLRDTISNMQDTIRELTAQMKQQENWPPLDFGSPCTIVGCGISAWKAVIDRDWAFRLTSTAVTLAPVVYRTFRDSDINLADKPLACAALAEREFTQNRETTGLTRHSKRRPREGRA
jgi:hypothetical protein